MNMKAGIIGGTGKMGRLFAPVFERAGYEMIVSGRTTALTNADIWQRPAISSLSLCPSATPCGSSVRSPRSSEKTRFLCDFTSLKVAPVAAMLKSEAQVIGLHPMFGPTVSSIARQTIIMCPARITGTMLPTSGQSSCTRGPSARSRHRRSTTG